LAVGVVLALVVGFAAGRLTSDTSPSEVMARAAAASTGGSQPVSATPAPLTGKEADPAAAVAKALSPAAVQLSSKEDLGSGFIYDSSGLILTAAHVVAGHDTMQVRLNDGTQLTGKVIGSDTGTDIAVLRVDAGRKLPVAPLALGVTVEVGQTAIALGSPYGLDQTVTAGIVSAVGRAISTQDNGEVAMIQTDAPINPGNSGGMLANRFGQVIGVNDSIISGSGASGGEAGNVGVGFAIPIDLAKSIADRLVAGKPIEYGYLGVRTKDATGRRAGGLLVDVEAGSPAAKAGLKPDDVVIKVGDNPVAGGDDLAAAIRAHQPGDRVKLTYVRGGATESTVVTVEKSP
jgi:putative serine protease PepD